MYIPYIELVNWITDAARDDNDALPPKCISEIESHRRQLMNDFQISPELVVMCAKDIQVIYHYMFKNAAAKISMMCI